MSALWKRDALKAVLFLIVALVGHPGIARDGLFFCAGAFTVWAVEEYKMTRRTSRRSTEP